MGDPVVAHAQAHDFSHSQSGYSVRRVEMGDNNSIYMTLAFAGVAMMAAMVVGIVVIRRRNGRHPHHQGFVEVDQTASPEERHVANMQMNENEKKDHHLSKRRRAEKETNTTPYNKNPLLI